MLIIQESSHHLQAISQQNAKQPTGSLAQIWDKLTVARAFSHQFYVFGFDANQEKFDFIKQGIDRRTRAPRPAEQCGIRCSNG